MDQTNRPKINPILLAVFILILVGGAIYFVWYFAQNGTGAKYPFLDREIQPTFSPTKTAIPTSAANWQTYADAETGISFKYPANYQISGNGSAGEIYLQEEDGFWRYVITITPNRDNLSLKEIADKEFDDLANQISEDRTEQNAKPVSFIKTDIILDGIPAKKMVTDREISYSPSAEVVLVKDANIIAIKPRSGDQEFDTILSTFKFTSSGTQASTADWKTYENTKYNFKMVLNNHFNGYLTTEAKESPFMVGNIDFKIPSSEGYSTIFSIAVYSPDQWKKIEDAGFGVQSTAFKDGLKYIDKNNKYVFAYSESNTLPKDLENIDFSVGDIIKSFQSANMTSAGQSGSNVQH